jgi:hypothetical protein
MIEDGNIDIPSIFCRDTVGERIATVNKDTLQRLPALHTNLVVPARARGRTSDANEGIP